MRRKQDYPGDATHAYAPQDSTGRKMFDAWMRGDDETYADPWGDKRAASVMPTDHDERTTYKIVRFYQKDSEAKKTIITGLTLEQAQAHCDDPESSSTTTTDPREEAAYGPWFDGYYEE